MTERGTREGIDVSRLVIRRVPIQEPLNAWSIWEHTPLDPNGCGEYPRWIRPIRNHVRTEDVLVSDNK